MHTHRVSAYADVVRKTASRTASRRFKVHVWRSLMEVYAAVLAETEGGAVAMNMLNWAARFGESRMELYGTDASLVYKMRGDIVLTGKAGDHRQSAALGFFHRQRKHGLIQARVADRELRGVHADGEPAAAGVDVIAAEGALAPAVEAARGIERERVRGDRDAAPQQREDLGRHVGPMHRGC
jgi:hypothetical protein